MLLQPPPAKIQTISIGYSTTCASSMLHRFADGLLHEALLICLIIFVVTVGVYLNVKSLRWSWLWAASYLSTHAPPAKVFVKIITPPEVARNLSDAFKALLERYPSLEFVGARLEIDAPVVMRRFQGFANFVGGVPTAWDKNARLRSRRRRGVLQTAGSSMRRVYLRDRNGHDYLPKDYGSGTDEVKLLDAKLTQAGLGRTWIVPNEEALFGTVGTTPIVNFNEWGEILKERGDIQYAVHQYKTDRVLSDIIWKI
ncbi:hypothetical protein ACJ72_05605 [Emergomyces africanus]|uniref:Uncharacterized protein n=1 Tax=Emergomyces africanus TaxID=1955775 RepID=A0A1B7NTG0_9EURO|nr:hypothetical protein ACJ72_05605 [Emergomyces africanus]